MKALPKRKGNDFLDMRIFLLLFGLNESPSEQEGKCVFLGVFRGVS